MTKEYSGHDVTLTIGGVPIESFVADTIKIKAPKSVIKSIDVQYSTPSEYANWWFTTITTRWSPVIWVNSAKPTKRQLRKYKRLARQEW